jgi:hypothetical protein
MSLELKTGLTKRSLVFGLIYSMIVVVFVTIVSGLTSLNPDATAQAPWDISGPDWTARIHTAPLLYFVMLVPLIISSLLPKNSKFTQSELTVIYSMIMSSCFLGYTWCLAIYPPLVWLPSGIAQGEPWLSYFLDAVPEIWLPGKDLALMSGFLYGGAPVPWNVWLPPLMYWALWAILYGYIFIFMAALLKKAYTRTLALPFPLAEGAKCLIQTSSVNGSNSPSVFRHKWLWTGFIIGVLIHLMGVFHFYIPEIPFYRPRVDLTPTIQGVLPFCTLILSFDAFYIGACYLLTKEILITTIIFTFLIGIVYPSMFVSYFGGPGGMAASAWMVWGYTAMHWWGAPELNFSLQSLVVGVVLGMTIWLFWRARADIKELFTLRSSEKSADELPKKYLWIGLIVTFILYILILTIANVPVWWTIISMIILAVWQIGVTVWRGDSGMAAGFAMLGTMGGRYVIAITWAITLWILGGAPALAVGMPMQLLTFFIYDQGQGTWTMPFFSMETFKLGELTRTKDRDVLLSQLIAYALGIIVVMPLALYCGYTWGILGKWSWTDLQGSAGAWSIQFAAQSVKEGIWHTGPNPPGTPFDISVFITGLLLSLGFYLIRFRFPTFPLHPAGILLGALFYGQLWMPALMALIAKYITMKVGGTKMYEEKGIPVAVGLIMSMGFIMILEIIGRLITGV